MNWHYTIKILKRTTVFFLYLHLGLANVQAQTSTTEAAIHKAYVLDKTQGNQSQLKNINQNLEKTFNQQDTNSNRYWLSYGLYNQALIADFQNDKKLAESLIDRAIALLKSLENDAEAQALMAIQMGYSIRFKSYWAMMNLGRKASFHANRAVELNPNSIRTNLAVAINDFYTPKAFGGGKRVENSLKKALEVTPSKGSPTWGKVLVYELLVKHYRKLKHDQIAQDYLSHGLAEFPESELLLELK